MPIRLERIISGVRILGRPNCMDPETPECLPDIGKEEVVNTRLAASYFVLLKGKGIP